MKLLESLHWRHAVKRMNGKTIPEEKVLKIIETARMAPTSSGLQPFKIILIKNQELKEKILPIANNQLQVVECSDLLIFAACNGYNKERIDKVFDNMELIRELPQGRMDKYKNSVHTNMTSKDVEEQFEHAARQAYIAFGLAIGAAAELKVDASPMEGFDNKQLDAFLELEKIGLKSVTLLALGYSDEDNDWVAPLKKVRLPLEEILIIKE